MMVHIELVYLGWDNTIMQKGNFPVDQRKFKEDPDYAAAEVALKWIREIRREHEVSKIIKVTYNKEHDITDLVKDLDTRIYDIDLPF